MSENRERGERRKIYKLDWLIPDNVVVIRSAEKPFSIIHSPKHNITEVLQDGSTDLVKAGYRILSLTSASSEDSIPGLTDMFVGVVERSGSPDAR